MNRAKTVGLLLTIAVVGVVGGIALLMVFKFELFTHRTRDMEPTIKPNELIMISRSSENIRRGDIVVFRYPADQSQVFVKRIVGLPGEVVAIHDGTVFIDQKPLEEGYLSGKLNSVSRSFPEYRVPTQSYYVLGDNRDASNDSRMWGALSADMIYGRVIFK